MRLTERGLRLAIAAVALWCAAFAFASALASMVALGLTLAFAWAYATIPVPSLSIRRTVARERFTEGEIIVEDLEIATTRRKTIRARALECATAGLDAPDASNTLRMRLVAGKPVSWRISWTAVTWGPKTIGPLTLVVTDALGLLEADVTDEHSIPLRVHPRAQKLGKLVGRRANPEPALGAHSVSRPGDSTDFFALRDYQPGDSIRRINWKASARTGGMVVNQAMRDTFARVIVILDLRAKEDSGPEAGSPRTYAGRAAASILSHHERMRDHLSLVAVRGDAVRLSLAANPAANDLLDALSRLDANGDMAFDQAIQKHLRILRPRSKVYVVTSAALDERLVEGVRLARGIGCDVTVLSPRAQGALAQASRTVAAREVKASGIPFVDWDGDVPLEVAIRGA
jgi:uncharacterized protein (DUF58 family)